MVVHNDYYVPAFKIAFFELHLKLPFLNCISNCTAIVQCCTGAMVVHGDYYGVGQPPPRHTHSTGPLNNGLPSEAWPMSNKKKSTENTSRIRVEAQGIDTKSKRTQSAKAKIK